MGKHRTTVRSRRAAGSVVAAGAIPLIATLIGAGTAHADVLPVPLAPPAVPAVLPALPSLPALPVGLLPPAADPAGDPFEAARVATRAAARSATDAVTAATTQFIHPAPGALLSAAPMPTAPPGFPSTPEDRYPTAGKASSTAGAAAPIDETPTGTLRVGDLEPSLLFDTRDLDAGAAQAQEQLAAFLDSSGIERGRADRVAAQAMSSGLIGAGIGAAVAAPVAVPFAMLGAAAGFVVGLPFLPTGLVVGPVLGATIAYGVVTVPAVIAGAALGAAYGATDGFTTQPFGPLPPL